MDPTRRAERLGDGEELAYLRTMMRNFFEDLPDDRLRRWVPTVASDDYRAWVVRDGAELVGTLGTYSMTTSVPGGGRVPMAGVTAVGVAQTHRRRGLLREMMTAALDEAAERDEPVSMLYASEGPIYGRFGYGVTAPGVVHRIDRGATFRDPVDPGLIRPARPEQARAEWPAILERLRDRRGGCASRDDEGWRLAVVEEDAAERPGLTGRRLVHVPDRGYLAYRVEAATDQALPAGRVEVQELVAVDPEAEAALWQHACDVDLTTVVEAWYRPPDDALTHLLVDPLRARTRVGPPLHARLLDVAAAFSARGYAVDGEVTLGIHDESRDQSGTYRIAAADGRAEVQRVDGEPDVTMPVDVAASVWLGGVPASQLRAARRLVEHVPGTVARLDRLMSVDRAPWTPFEF